MSDDEDAINPADDAAESQGEDIEGFKSKNGGRRQGSGRKRWNVAELEKIARGQPVMGTGPTGKPTSQRASVSERLRAMEMLNDALEADAKAKAEIAPDPLSLKDMAFKFLMEHMPQEKVRIPVYEPARPDPTTPGSLVIHDPADVAKHIRPTEADNPNERHFPNGWRWTRVHDHSVNAYRWLVYAPGMSDHSAIKRSEDAASKLCLAEGSHL